MIRSMMVAAGAVFALTAAKALNSPGAEPLVSTSWLSQHLTDRDVVIIQVSRKADYDNGHIAGARFAEGGLESDMMGSGAAMDMTRLPTTAEIQAKLEKLGVSDRSHVVVAYVGKGAPSATRVIYLMHRAGVDNVSLLDGGMAGWQSAKLPVTQDVPSVTPGKITVAGNDLGAADHDWVLAHLNAPHIKIVDARDTVYYSGPPQAQMDMAAGHIPGAKNIPYWSLFSDTGLLLSPAAIQAKFRAAGVQPGDTVVAYCHVGVQATSVVFAARLIGQPVKMYVGSFHDWSAHKSPTEGGKP